MLAVDQLHARVDALWHERLVPFERNLRDGTPSRRPERLTVVDLTPGEPLPEPVPLARIKAEPAFADLGLVRMSRLSVVPVPPAQWRKLLAMGGVSA